MSAASAMLQDSSKAGKLVTEGAPGNAATSLTPLVAPCGPVLPALIGGQAPTAPAQGAADHEVEEAVSQDDERPIT